MRFLTYDDAVVHLLDYLSGAESDQTMRDVRRSALQAYDALINAHNWAYLYRLGRFITSPVFSNATLSYQDSSGTYPHQFTLDAGFTWPSWAAYGFIRIGTVNFRVAERKSNTIVTCDPLLSPGPGGDALYPPGTGFSLYQDSYTLPDDFIAADQAMYERNFGGMQYTHPQNWAYENRYLFAQGVPYSYTITGDYLQPGHLMIRVFPFPIEAKTIDYVYKRRPRPVVVYQQFGGTVATTAGSNVIVGSGTNFSPSNLQSVIRISNNTNLPTGPIGNNPPVFESAIQSWVSATQVITADPCPVAVAGNNYMISDPFDVEIGAMRSALLRGMEYQIARSRSLKGLKDTMAQYEYELREAKIADNRSFAQRYEGMIAKFRQRLRDMPRGPDQE